MDTKSNKGINVNLKEKLNFEEFNKRDLLFTLINCTIDEEANINNNNNGEKNINLLIAKIIYNDKNNDINFKFININFKLNN